MADALAKLRDRRPDWAKAVSPRPPSRACGACDLCCTVEEIPEMGKPALWPCAHLKTGPEPGCSIWGEPTRPKACAVFLCLWRASDTLLPPDLFPPDCGFLMQVSPVRVWPLVVSVVPAAGRGLAWDTPDNRARFAALARAWNAAVVCMTETLAPSLAFAPAGGVYDARERPDVFPAGHVALDPADYLPDRREPIALIREAAL